MTRDSRLNVVKALWLSEVKALWLSEVEVILAPVDFSKSRRSILEQHNYAIR